MRGDRCREEEVKPPVLVEEEAGKVKCNRQEAKWNQDTDESNREVKEA